MRIIEKGCDPSIKLAKFKFNCDECDKSGEFDFRRAGMAPSTTVQLYATAIFDCCGRESTY